MSSATRLHPLNWMRDVIQTVQSFLTLNEFVRTLVVAHKWYEVARNSKGRHDHLNIPSSISWHRLWNSFLCRHITSLHVFHPLMIPLSLEFATQFAHLQFAKVCVKPKSAYHFPHSLTSLCISYESHTWGDETHLFRAVASMCPELRSLEVNVLSECKGLTPPDFTLLHPLHHLTHLAIYQCPPGIDYRTLPTTLQSVELGLGRFTRMKIDSLTHLPLTKLKLYTVDVGFTHFQHTLTSLDISALDTPDASFLGAFSSLTWCAISRVAREVKREGFIAAIRRLVGLVTLNLSFFLRPDADEFTNEDMRLMLEPLRNLHTFWCVLRPEFANIHLWLPRRVKAIGLAGQYYLSSAARQYVHTHYPGQCNEI